MTKQEFSVIASAIRTFYPREKILPNEQAADLWFNLLKDIPYDVAQVALNKWAATNRWSPAISDIRELAAEITSPEVPDWSEGWEAVQLALRRYGYYRQAEALATLPELARKAVERLGWQNICLSEELGVERANFRQIYEALANREKADRKIPTGLHQLASGIRVRIEEKNSGET